MCVGSQAWAHPSYDQQSRLPNSNLKSRDGRLRKARAPPLSRCCLPSFACHPLSHKLRCHCRRELPGEFSSFTWLTSLQTSSQYSQRHRSTRWCPAPAHVTAFCGSADFTFRHLRCWDSAGKQHRFAASSRIDIHQCLIGIHSTRPFQYFTSLHVSRLPKFASTGWPPRKAWVSQEVPLRQPHRFPYPDQWPGPIQRLPRNRLRRNQDSGSAFESSRMMATPSPSQGPSGLQRGDLAILRKPSYLTSRLSRSKTRHHRPLHLSFHLWILCL